MPAQPEKTENVVFLGCTPPAFPDKTLALLDVLEKMGIDFVALDGGDLCCGFPFCPAAGRVKASEQKARDLVAGINAFSPKRAVLLCAGCYHQFTKLYRRFLDLDFEVQYYAQFLNDHLDKINFTKPLEKTAILHKSCMSGRANVNESSMKLIERIPGLKTVQAQPNCCGGTIELTISMATIEANPKIGTINVDDILEFLVRTIEGAEDIHQETVKA